MRVLVVDDNTLIRAGIVALLKNQGEFEFIGEAADGIGAIEKAKELKCDLVLMDISLPGVSGFTAARLILDLLPHCHIIYVTNHLSPGMIAEALQTGARGYIAKTDLVPDLKKGMDAVVRGRRFVSRSCAGILPDVGSGESIPPDGSFLKFSS